MIYIGVTMHKLGRTGSLTPIATQLAYDGDDPYAVHIDLENPDDHVEWILARDLLADGLLRRSGEGDVHLRPVNGVIEISLYSEEGHAVVYADAHQIAAFLMLTYAAVAQGKEADAVDIGAELDRLFGEAA